VKIRQKLPKSSALNVSERAADHLDQAFPTWGICTLMGTFAYSKGYI